MHQYRSISIRILAGFGVMFLSVTCNQHPAARKDVKESPRLVTGNKLSVKDMRADLFILWSAIKELHPGYGKYFPADSIARSYDATFSTLNEPMYEGGFISRMYPFLCTLGCGHTQIKHSAGYQSPPGITVSHLPFEVLVRHDRAWVTTRKTDKLATGDEIISINNEPASAIIQHGRTLYCGDGYVASFKELYLSEYDGFEDVCNIYYKWTAPYHVSVRTREGVLKTVTLDSTTVPASGNVASTDKYAHWTKAKSAEDLALYFSKQNSTALFEVKGLEYTDTIAYADFFDQIAHKRSKNLILDLRHNGGGDLRIVIKLLSYLADSSFGIVKDIRCRLPDPSSNSFPTYFDPERTESFKSSCLPGRRENNWYHMDIRPDFARPYGPIPTAGSGRFRGNLFVLVDGGTFSSAALLASALKAQRKNIVFIGRETAGAEEGCNGFTIQRLTLPNTRIVVEFPWLQVVSMAASPVPGRGIIPEYPVDYTPEDIVKGSDPDLVRALQLIAGDKNTFY